MVNMAGIIRKVRAAVQNSKTYQIGLLQTKAYRVLKQFVDDALEHLKVTSTEWAFLGLLYEANTGMRAMDIAHELGVEAPFVTVLIKKLEKQGFIEAREDSKDRRAKRICLTDLGRTFVKETEVYLRGELRTLIKGGNISDIASYITVLELIIENNPKK
jgi:MarR family transcriptional regulator for hemolysin